MVKEINSLQNSLVKLISSLQDKKNIIKHDVCFVESEKVVLDLLSSGAKINTILLTKEKFDKLANLINKNNNIEIIIVSDNVAKHISNMVTNDGVFALVKIDKDKKLNGNENFLLLDNLQDATNFGAIIRSALAFNFKQIIAINSVYPYLSKVIRSSMGYVFKVNIISLNDDEFKELYVKHKLNLIGAHLQGEILHSFKISNAPFGLVIGNEGNGISPEILNMCSQLVKIPMNNDVESLNAAVSSSIIMYELTNR